ncbi:hypothetical protein WP8S18E04_05990 [Aeromonas caviae]|nr:hypothetical protein WP8S18E04_05990 [Aeromonas caviae]
MVSSVIEQLMQTPIVLLPPSLATHAQRRRDHYGQSGH